MPNQVEGLHFNFGPPFPLSIFFSLCLGSPCWLSILLSIWAIHFVRPSISGEPKQRAKQNGEPKMEGQNGAPEIMQSQSGGQNGKPRLAWAQLVGQHTGLHPNPAPPRDTSHDACDRHMRVHATHALLQPVLSQHSKDTHSCRIQHATETMPAKRPKPLLCRTPDLKPRTSSILNYP